MKEWSTYFNEEHTCKSQNNRINIHSKFFNYNDFCDNREPINGRSITFETQDEISFKGDVYKFPDEIKNLQLEKVEVNTRTLTEYSLTNNNFRENLLEKINNKLKKQQKEKSYIQLASESLSLVTEDDKKEESCNLNCFDILTKQSEMKKLNQNSIISNFKSPDINKAKVTKEIKDVIILQQSPKKEAIVELEKEFETDKHKNLPLQMTSKSFISHKSFKSNDSKVSNTSHTRNKNKIDKELKKAHIHDFEILNKDQISKQLQINNNMINTITSKNKDETDQRSDKLDSCKLQIRVLLEENKKLRSLLSKYDGSVNNSIDHASSDVISPVNEKQLKIKNEIWCNYENNEKSKKEDSLVLDKRLFIANYIPAEKSTYKDIYLKKKNTRVSILPYNKICSHDHNNENLDKCDEVFQGSRKNIVVVDKKDNLEIRLNCEKYIFLDIEGKDIKTTKSEYSNKSSNFLRRVDITNQNKSKLNKLDTSNDFFDDNHKVLISNMSNLEKISEKHESEENSKGKNTLDSKVSKIKRQYEEEKFDYTTLSKTKKRILAEELEKNFSSLCEEIKKDETKPTIANKNNNNNLALTGSLMREYSIRNKLKSSILNSQNKEKEDTTLLKKEVHVASVTLSSLIDRQKIRDNMKEYLKKK